jgi:predicted DNA-binding transcriptional regulator YafY
MADRVERLTNLLALLLETHQPLSLRQIGSDLDGQYPDGENARRAAFERDKASLREIGVPIETEIVVGGPEAGQTRYRIDRAAYELTDLDLEPDEVRALQVAAATIRTEAGQDAIWKLGGALGDERPAVSAVLPDRPELPMIRTAVSSRSPISFRYRGQERTIDPWGVLLRGGFWYVVGHDHDRSAQRTFRVDRFDGSVEVHEPASFERPADFDPRQAFPSDPKQIGHAADEGVEATVLVDAIRADAIARELGDERIVARRDDGSIEVVVPATNLDAFRSWLLGLLEHAVVLDPPEVRGAIVEWLESLVGESS